MERAVVGIGRGQLELRDYQRGLHITKPLFKLIST